MLFDEKDNSKAEKALNEIKAWGKCAKNISKNYINIKQHKELKKEMNYESQESLDNSLSM